MNTLAAIRRIAATLLSERAPDDDACSREEVVSIWNEACDTLARIFPETLAVSMPSFVEVAEVSLALVGVSLILTAVAYKMIFKRK